MSNSQERVVLITGAGKGAGRRAAQAFASQGARLALNDIAPNNVETLLEELNQGGCTARVFIEDVAKKLSAQVLINRVLEGWGRIDVLVNHAMVEPRAELLKMDEWDWHRTLDVNLTGTFLMTQSVGRLMCEQGAGVILNLLSLPGEAEAVSRAAYGTTQMGLLGLTRQAASELAGCGIRVHALGQGLAEFQHSDKRVPRRLEEAVLFLCESRAAELTGLIIQTE